jgi:hypothetical protein
MELNYDKWFISEDNSNIDFKEREWTGFTLSRGTSDRLL